jgi:uncharacterized small protein (DUF1192 family)
LCNEIERLQAELAGITEEHARVWGTVHVQGREIDRLRAERDALKAALKRLMIRVKTR